MQNGVGTHIFSLRVPCDSSLTLLGVGRLIPAFKLQLLIFLDYTVHTEKEHNRLHYLYYFAYLKDKIAKKQTKSLSPLEAYIEAQVISDSKKNAHNALCCLMPRIALL